MGAIVTICGLPIAIPVPISVRRLGLVLKLLRRRDRILGDRRWRSLCREGCEAVGDGNDKPVDLRRDRFIITDRETAQAFWSAAVAGIEFSSCRLARDDEEIGTKHLIAHHSTRGLNRDAAVIERLQGRIRRCRSRIERHPVIRALPPAAFGWIHTLLRQELCRNPDPYPGLRIVDQSESGCTSGLLGGGKQGGAGLRRQNSVRRLLHPHLKGRDGCIGLTPEGSVR